MDAVTKEGILTGSIGAGVALPATPAITLRATYDAASSITAPFLLEILPDAVGEPDIIPCIQEFAFVLDESGSMEMLTETGMTKWARMLEVVETHWPTLRAWADLDEYDRWAIVLFEGNRAELVQSGNFGEAPDVDAIDAGHVIGGGTPMGAGIQRALIDFLSPADQAWKQRNIILLTDGMQNRNPMVTVDGLNLHLNPAKMPPGGILGGAFPMVLSTFNTKVFAIGLGALSMDVQALVDNLSEAYENADNPGLDDFFQNTIPTALESSSPRILDMRRGTMPIFTQFGEESFVVNDSVKSLTLKFVATDGKFTSEQISVLKNGSPINATPDFRNDRMVLYHFNFPEDSIITGASTSKGTWSLKFADFKPFTYEITASVNEENIKTKLDFNATKDFYAGDDLPVRLRLSYQGSPVTSGAVVRAWLLRPGDDLGDLMANTAISVDSLVFSEPQQSAGYAKIAALSLRQDIIDQLKRDSNFIVLNHAGNGAYTGTFTDNKLTGSYRVIVKVDGNHPLGGKYIGWVARSAVFDFSRPDDIILQEVLVDLGLDADGGHNYQLVVTPVNKFGRKIGPAQENRIRVSVAQGTVGLIKDNLDGSYTTNIRVPQGANPTVSVYVIDMQQPVLHASLNDIGNARAFGMSAHAGATLPMGNLSSPYTGQFMAELDLTYRIGGGFGAELVGGYYGFQPDFYILGGTLFGTYRLFSGNTWSLYGGLGVGVFGPKNENATLGMGLKAGITRSLGSHWQAGLEAGYYSLPKPGYQFGTSALCFKYFF